MYNTFSTYNFILSKEKAAYGIILSVLEKKKMKAILQKWKLYYKMKA